MYSVLLNNEKYFTGNFAKVGSIPGGIMVDTLPSDIYGEKSLYWKYGEYEVEKIIQNPIQSEPIKTPVIDESTGEQKVDENGELVYIELPGEITYEEQVVTETKFGWNFDKEKYETEVIEKIKKEKIDFLESYKHQARLYFPYGNVEGIQRFADEDINFINLTIQGMKNGLLTEVYWKYSNGRYDKVTDVAYFEEMLLKGGLLINKAFSAEALVVEEIKTLTTVEALDLYNEKVKFDEYFNGN